MPTHVTSTPPVPPSDAAKHFAHKLALETDCWDVRETLKEGSPDFVLLDAVSYTHLTLPTIYSV